MEDYTCEQLQAVINDPNTNAARIAEAARLFNAKCGVGAPGGEPGGQSGGVPVKHPPHVP